MGQYGILYEAFDDNVASDSEGDKDYSPYKSIKQCNMKRALTRSVLITYISLIPRTCANFLQ